MLSPCNARASVLTQLSWGLYIMQVKYGSLQRLSQGIHIRCGACADLVAEQPSSELSTVSPDSEPLSTANWSATRDGKLRSEDIFVDKDSVYLPPGKPLLHMPERAQSSSQSNNKVRAWDFMNALVLKRLSP